MKHLALVLLSAATLHAAPFLSLSDTSVADLQPGGSFVITLTLTNSDATDVFGYDFYVRANTAGIFQITDQTLNPPLTSTNYLGTISPETPYFVTTNAMDDLGARSPSFVSGFATGTAPVQILTFEILPTAATGSYSLTFGWNQPTSANGGPGFVDLEGGETQMSDPLTVAVQIVPEPSTASLALAASIFLLHRGKQNQRKRLFTKGNEEN